MFDPNRRRFLQATSAFLGSATFASAFGEEARPAFAETPTFDPVALFLTWQRDPTTTMTIQWVGAEQDAKTRPIWYARQGSMEWKHAAPTLVRRFPMTDLWIFRTELRGLEPEADYQFRLGLDSAERRFRTMPAKGTNTLHFVSGGDSGIGEKAMQTNRLAAAQAPMFVVLGGDLAYENGTDAHVFLRFIKNYSQQLIDDQNRLIPLLVCLGNHEVRGGYFQPRDKAPFFFAFFDGLFSETGYAVLDFGDYLSLLLLDTNHISPIAGEQTSWLEKRLKEREDCPAVFAFNHVPSYPSVRPFQNSDGTAATGGDSRKHWTPLFERYNVDAVFEHHDHAYKRTYPLLDGLVDRNGITYLGDGSWGLIRKPKGPADLPFLAVSHEAYHLSVHRIEGDQRFHVALSDTGKVVDTCATTKRPSTLRAKSPS
jgi:acid phosphatase type 7